MRYDQFNDRELELLTAGVDGELSRREMAELRTLLANKPEAALLFKQFQADAATLHDMPKMAAPNGMTSAILARLTVAAPAPSKYAPNRRPAWMLAAIAASVLFTVASGSYLFSNVREQNAQAKAVRDQLPVLAPNTLANEPDRDSVVLAKAKPGPRLPQQHGKPGPDIEPLNTNNLAQSPKVAELAPAPRILGSDVLGGGILDHIKPLIGAEIRLNPIIDAADFGNMDIQPFLSKELSRDPAYRLDMFSKNSAAGLEALFKAAKAVGIVISVDAKLQDLLNRKLPVAVALYTEALTPAEVAALLAELAKQVKAASPPSIGSTHLIPAGANEVRDAKELFGIDLQLLKSPRIGSSSTGDPKPLSADTLGKVASAVKKNDKPAIVSAYLPTPMRTPANQSKEVKDFLLRKGDRKPGTIAMLFVIRS